MNIIVFFSKPSLLCFLPLIILFMYRIQFPLHCTNFGYSLKNSVSLQGYCCFISGFYCFLPKLLVPKDCFLKGITILIFIFFITYLVFLLSFGLRVMENYWLLLLCIGFVSGSSLSAHYSHHPYYTNDYHETRLQHILRWMFFFNGRKSFIDWNLNLYWATYTVWGEMHVPVNL